MKDLFEKLDARKKEMDSISPVKLEDADRLWSKLRLEWNYNSNHIEGNTLTYQETELVVIFDQEPNGGHTVREIEEMKAHDVAIALVQEWARDKSRKISNTDIRNLNTTLLVRPFWKEAITSDGQSVRRLIKVGEYKEHPNHVRLANGEIFKYAEPHEVESKMSDLVEWHREATENKHPVFVAAKLHYDFVCIHPFDDGNGRVSRLLLNYHLLSCGFPPIIIKSSDKRGYLAALNRADVGDFEAFVRYIGAQMMWSLDLSIRAAKGESVEEEGDWEKQIELLKRAADGKVAGNESAKNTDIAKVGNWLEANFVTLKTECEQKIGVFDKFFESSTFRITSQTKPNNSRETLHEPYDLSALAATIVASKNPAKLFVEFHFEKPKYNFIKINIYQLHIIVSFSKENITLSNYINEVQISDVIFSKIELPYSSRLTKGDILPVKELAKIFQKEIESAIAQS